MNSMHSRWVGVSLLLLGAAGCGTGFNRSPVVQEGPVASVRDVASGEQVQMHLVVTDADGDELTYRWSQSPEEPAGVFSDISEREPGWTAPEVTKTQEFTFKAVIKDPSSATLLSYTSILVHPR